MFRVLLLFSLFPIAIALAARWWFGERVIAGEGGLACRCDLGRWLPAPSDGAIVHRAEATAAEFGKELRLKALAEWREQDEKGFASRENSRRFGLAVPPLSGVVAIMAMVVGKIPFMGAFTIFVAATALAAVFGLLSLPAELAAITRTANQARKDHAFPDRDQEDAVIRCALAHAWELALPPILRWVHR